MSVLLENMNMPKCCDDCKLNYDSIRCAVTKHRFCDEEHFDEYAERMKDCPLREHNEHINFIATYARAETIQDRIKCHMAKCLGAKVVTPLGRAVLLPQEYNEKAITTGNADLCIYDRLA